MNGRKDVLDIGSAPVCEPCAQVGTEGYAEAARAQCAAYKRQLLRHAKELGLHVPESLSLFVRSNAHDYGSYYEVAARYPAEDEEAVDAAFWFENNQPEKWDDEAKAELAAAGLQVSL